MPMATSLLYTSELCAPIVWREKDKIKGFPSIAVKIFECLRVRKHSY